MKNFIYPLIVNIFFVNYAIANDNVIFPKEAQKCTEIIATCSFDNERMCQKTLCGHDIAKTILNDFIMSNRLIGRKFESILEVESFLKEKLPKELKQYRIAFKTEGALALGYQSTILITLTQKNSITKIELF